MEGMEYSAAGGSYIWMDPLPSKRSKDDKKRRFSEEQIRSLESTFKSQQKLEPRQKQQLARDLGLQPRQVTIWFQNKRARWKSKKLEREYGTLRADYDALLSSFESLKNEKQILVKQLQELGSLLQERTRDADSDNGDARRQEGNKHNLCENDLRFIAGSDDELNSLSYSSQQESELYPAQPPVSSITSAEQQLCSTSGWLSDESCTNLQWWEFWPLSEYPTLLPEQFSAAST